jgi:hypothetical protein
LLPGFNGGNPAFVEQPQNGRARKIPPEPLFGFRIQSFLGNGYFDLNLHGFILPLRSRMAARRFQDTIS